MNIGQIDDLIDIRSTRRDCYCLKFIFVVDDEVTLQMIGTVAGNARFKNAYLSRCRFRFGLSASAPPFDRETTGTKHE